MNAPRSGSSHYTFRKSGCMPIYIICGIVYGVNQFFYAKFEKVSVFSEREIRKI